MQLIPRELMGRLTAASGWLPVISLTGPRQSGKSTLVREAFPAYEYLNLERPDIRAAALEDPVGFIGSRPARLIIDEAQYAPELFSAIQGASDERGGPGQYVLTGSQNFLLLRQIKQSLAGRVGILRLLPLSFGEVLGSFPDAADDADFMLRGGYPRLYDTPMELPFFFDGYVSTYVERDASDYLGVREITAFRRFLRLCAQRVGSLVNLTALASDAGVSFRTAKSWLSILESSYLVVELMPYHANLGKRLTKSPKLYFTDCGLLCHLLGIRSRQQLLTSPLLGPVFENLVVSETLKRRLNQGKTPELYFYRDDSKCEVDLLDFTDAGDECLVEVKSTETFRRSLGRHLVTVGESLGIPKGRRLVVYRGSQAIESDGFAACPVLRYLSGHC